MGRNHQSGGPRRLAALICRLKSRPGEEADPHGNGSKLLAVKRHSGRGRSIRRGIERLRIETDYLLTALASARGCGPARLALLSAISQAAASPELGSLLPGMVANPAFSMISRCVYDEVSSLSNASFL